jgi:hypothetical protein
MQILLPYLPHVLASVLTHALPSHLNRNCAIRNNHQQRILEWLLLKGVASGLLTMICCLTVETNGSFVGSFHKRWLERTGYQRNPIMGIPVPITISGQSRFCRKTSRIALWHSALGPGYTDGGEGNRRIRQPRKMRPAPERKTEKRGGSLQEWSISFPTLSKGQSKNAPVPKF